MMDVPFDIRAQQARLVYQERRRAARRVRIVRYTLLGLVLLAVLAAPSIAASRFRARHAVPLQTALTIKGATLTLNPVRQGTGPVTLRVTLADKTGAPLAGVPIVLVVSGRTAFRGHATTNGAGLADFQYHAGPGPYTVHITALATRDHVESTVLVGMKAPIATSLVVGRFFPSDNRCTFDVPAAAAPLFTRSDFATLNFAGRPFTAYSPSPTHPDVAATDGQQAAGLGRLGHFNAVFLGTFYVAHAGDVPFTILVDDAYNFGIGGGATRVNGALSNPPASGLTAFEHLPIVGAFNQGHLQATTTVTVRFPRSGVYAYELDYAECDGGGEALRISTAGQFLPTAF